MYTLLVVLALSVLVSSQNVNTLIAEIPACIAPCLQTIIQTGCGNANDWSCGCSLTGTADLNTACQTSVYTCYSSEIAEAISLVSQICAIEDSSSGGGAATSGSSGGVVVTTAPVPASTAPSPTHTRISSASQSRANRVRGATLPVYVMEVVWLTLCAVWLWPL